MDEPASNENPSKDFNKLDLAQLQGFSFGTQWTQDKSSAGQARRDDRPRREGDDAVRRDGPNEVRRDRRSFKKTVPSGPDAPSAPASDQARAEQPPGARDQRPAGAYDNRGPRPERGEYRGGPRRDGPGGGEFRGRPGGGRDALPERDRGPYISPFFNVIFYPEDIGFTALAKAIRTSCRTYELFEIARVIIGKNDRFVAVIQRKAPESSAPAGAGGASAEKLAPLAISIPDGLPFENEEAVVAHVMTKHLAMFFDSAEVEIDPPKGNFQLINKCGITGELLGPPNYHRYNQIVQQHHASHVARMSFEAYKSRIESVRDPEVVNQWLEKMKKTTRHTWKFSPEGTTPLTFDLLDDARTYLLTNAREKVVKLVESARFHGKFAEVLPPGEIRRSLEGALERQRRFPLDTANALRGRLRREGFTIFKKGSKGISYVCAVKRRFRVSGQTFSDSIGALIAYIEAHPMVRASELPKKLLNIVPPVAAAAQPVAVVEGTQPPIAISGSITPFALAQATVLSPEDQAKLHRLNGDLRWLVSEGYVTEFIDGRLFAPPPMTEARKQEVETDEHDPENFPEAPNTTPPMSVESAVSNSGETESPVETSVPVDAAPVDAAPMDAPLVDAGEPAVDGTVADAPSPSPDAAVDGTDSKI